MLLSWLLGSPVRRTVDGHPICFRSAMSAGNLHPVEVYVVGDDVHHYHPLAHALVSLREGVYLCDDVTLVLTGIPFVPVGSTGNGAGGTCGGR